jgi:NitT/TauT family transport system permease protein
MAMSDTMFTERQIKTYAMIDAFFIPVLRAILLIALLVLWEIWGRQTGSEWISQPSRIAERLWTGMQGNLPYHLGITLIEMTSGFLIGGSAGILSGLLLGRATNVAKILRPFIMAGYSLPLSTLAPLLILWFGIDTTPKIVLVSVVVYFLMLFTTMAGAQAIDEDLVISLKQMGAQPREIFRKVIAPASLAWIISGTKIALPYALVSVTVAEMLAGRGGLGSLITEASTQFDMTGIYTILVILMALGVALAAAAERLDTRLLRWRHGGR